MATTLTELSTSLTIIKTSITTVMTSVRLEITDSGATPNDYASTMKLEMTCEYIIEKAEGIHALSMALYGADMKETVIQSLAGELHRLVSCTGW